MKLTFKLSKEKEGATCGATFLLVWWRGKYDWKRQCFAALCTCRGVLLASSCCSSNLEHQNGNAAVEKQ